MPMKRRSPSTRASSTRSESVTKMARFARPMRPYSAKPAVTVGDDRPEDRHNRRTGDRRGEDQTDLDRRHPEAVEVEPEHYGEIAVCEGAKDPRREELLAVDAEPFEHVAS